MHHIMDEVEFSAMSGTLRIGVFVARWVRDPSGLYSWTVSLWDGPDDALAGGSEITLQAAESAARVWLREAGKKLAAAAVTA